MPNASALAESPARFARELSAAKTRGEAQATIERWRARLSAPAEARRAPIAPSDGVGIWRPERIDGQTWFVRDRHAVDPWSWARVERIAPKRGTRIVFLGESCARGYLLDPLFNCASALDAYLASAAGPGAIEVVDLARLAIRAPALLTLLHDAAALEPDLYVIFAGNNWNVNPDDIDVREVAAAAKNGWRAVTAYCEQLVRSQIAQWTTELTRILAASRVPALFVIPAENTQDLPHGRTLYNPLLPSDRQIVRDQLLDRVDALQDDGRFAESEPLAAEIVALEDGCSIAGLQALGRCAQARGSLDEAVRLFHAAREQLVSLPVVGMSSYVVRTEELRAGLAAAGVPTVDLPRLFAGLSGGAPLGRVWFYDDCHMTAGTIVVAMAAVAEAVLPLLGRPARPDVIAATPIAIAPRAEAQAECLAAFVNAHDLRLVSRYVRGVLAKSREIGAVLRQYLELRLRRLPVSVCPAFHRLRELEATFPALRHLDRALGDRVRPDCDRDAAVTRVIAQAIADDYPDAPSRREALLRRKYGADRDEVDVLAYATGQAEFMGRLAQDKSRAYIQCPHWRTRFHLLAKSSPRRWRLRLTARVPRRGAAGKRATLLVNGRVVTTWTVSDAWATVEAVHESWTTAAEVDELAIIWPDPDETRDERVTRLAHALAEGSSAAESISDVYTIWGEIQSFRAWTRVLALEAAMPARAVEARACRTQPS